ncbi:MAG TPA: hypothetical protein VJS91_03975, partial [Nitrososphaeraceae archaeon]|nr:hypothetical protein [Nitrososphaeraceae archaeon]
MTSIKITNPYSKPARFYITATQNNPLYRTYLEHTYLTLEAGQSADVGIMFEYVVTMDKKIDTGLNPNSIKEYAKVANNINLIGWIDNPMDPEYHSPLITGGAQIQVVTGKRTEIKDLKTKGGVVTGNVIRTDTSKPVSRGKVIVTQWTKKGKKLAEVNSDTVLLKKGIFRTKLMAGISAVEAYFIPSDEYADCSAEIEINKGSRLN